MAGTDLSELVTVNDFGRAAHVLFSDRARAYIDSGAGDEHTLADNLAAWNRFAIAPRVLTGAGRPDRAVTVLGRRHPHPLIVAPTAFAALAHPDAEPGIARAARTTGTTLTLSTLASVTPEQLALAAPDCHRWFQLYVFTDRGITRELVATAQAHGYDALVITADRPVLGTRDSESRHDIRGVSPDDGTVGRFAPRDTPMLIEDSLAWTDVEAITRETDLPVLVKGVLTAADARAAAAHGATGVVVSNHGGRQLDTVLSGADALPEIADAVGDQIDVIVDGGVRRGIDVVKALALGARAVMVGRPLLWGLAVGGELGAQRVLEILLAELDTALALTGVAAAQLSAEHVRRAPWAV